MRRSARSISEGLYVITSIAGHSCRCRRIAINIEELFPQILGPLIASVKNADRMRPRPAKSRDDSRGDNHEMIGK